MVHHVGERRRRADLDAAIGGRLHAAQSLHATEIDDYLAALVAILEPVEGVQTAGEHPRILLVLLEQRDGVIDGRRLKQLEDGHYVVDYCHVPISNNEIYEFPNLRIAELDRERFGNSEIRKFDNHIKCSAGSRRRASSRAGSCRSRRSGTGCRKCRAPVRCAWGSDWS